MQTTFPTHRKDAQPQAASPPTPPVGTRTLLFAAVLTPVALLPYLLLRRHVRSLHSELSRIAGMTTIVRNDVRAVLAETTARREELSRLRSVAERLGRDLDAVRVSGEQRDDDRKEEGDKLRKELGVLGREMQRASQHLAMSREVGKSLADVAAFMHEVELQQGFVTRRNDGRGIEQIRQVAYKLERLPQPDVKPPDPESVDPAIMASGSPPKTKGKV